MNHFAYPKDDKKIVRYTVLYGDKQGYEKVSPDAAGFEVIYDAVRILVPESARILPAESPDKWLDEIHVYRKNTCDAAYTDSQNLAYLLACINFFRWTALKTNGDIWCAGSIDIPLCLNKVDDSDFDIKLEAFLSQEDDKIFIVPEANASNRKGRILSKSVRLISVTEFKVSEYSESSKDKEKTILKVKENELELLVEKILVKSSEKEPCTHFAYPNVQRKYFMGCGRYAVLSGPPRNYKIANPRGINIGKIFQVLERLIPEQASEKSEKYIYEIKDDSNAAYVGDSQDLAYLLALINRFRDLSLRINSDIWCTGSIDIIGNNSPFLATVLEAVFDAKLEGFLSEKNNDNLFIVPAANIRPKHQIWLSEKKVEVLSLNKFKFSGHKKSVLTVQGGELALLLEKLFNPPPLPIKQTFITTSWVTLSIFLLCWLQFFDFFYLDTKFERYTIALGDMLMEKTFNDDKIALIAIEEENFDKTWREHHATLIDKLSKAGARVIVFDLYFEEPGKFDDKFADSINQAKNRGTEVVIGVSDYQNNKPKIFEKLRVAIGKNYGIICVNEEELYAIKAPLALKKRNGDLFDSLSIKAVNLFYSQEIEYEHDRIILKHSAKGAEMEIKYTDVSLFGPCPIIQDGDMTANIYIDLSPYGLLRNPGIRFKYKDVIEPGYHCKRFKDKIILIGTQIRGKDCFRVLRGSRVEDCTFGMELHADVINTLLNCVHIRPLALQFQAIFIFLFAMAGALAKWRRISFGANTVLLILVLTGISIFTYCQYRILLHPAYYAAASILSHRLTFAVYKKS